MKWDESGKSRQSRCQPPLRLHVVCVHICHVHVKKSLDWTPLARHSPLIPALQGPRQANLCDFKANLVYLVSFRLARTIEWGCLTTVSKGQEANSKALSLPLPFLHICIIIYQRLCYREPVVLTAYWFLGPIPQCPGFVRVFFPSSCPKTCSFRLNPMLLSQESCLTPLIPLEHSLKCLFVRGMCV